jgi:ADP-ribose pyrophosphatase YjhB (NUDIX family)
MWQRSIGWLYGMAYPLARLWWRWRAPVKIGVRALVLDETDRVLLVRHAYGSEGWSFPGGGPRRREPLSATAVREVREETGIACQVERVLGIYDSFVEGKSDHVALFVCRANPGSHPQPASPEIRKAAFFPLTALPGGVAPGARRRLAELQAADGARWGWW